VSTPSDPTTFDVVGIGNALVDVLSTEPEEAIERLGLVKGAMTLIDTERAEQLYAAMGDKTEMSGGSAANTLSGVASFGGRGAYIGRVRDDVLGKAFAHDLNALGVHFTATPAAEGDPTGRCVCVRAAAGAKSPCH
jgi:sugar/nucleoside kinase (ribokinase family)